MEQLSLCTTNTEPTFLDPSATNMSSHSATTETCLSRTYASQQERPLHSEATKKSSPCLPQLENAGGSNKDWVQPKIKTMTKIIINTFKKSYFVHIFSSWICVFVFSWSSLNFLLDMLYFFHQMSFISSLLNGEWPCELHWQKSWASSHPQAQPRTTRTEGMSVDQHSGSCINQVTGWVQLTSRPPLSGLMLDQQLLHMSTMEWGLGGWVNVILT